MKRRSLVPASGLPLLFLLLLFAREAGAQGNPLEYPQEGTGDSTGAGDSAGQGDGNPLQPPSDDGNPLKPPVEEKPTEALKRASKEVCEAIKQKFDNKEKDEAIRRKLKLEAINEAAELDENSMVKLLVRAADEKETDEAVRKAAEEALGKKIKHLEGLYKNEAEEDRLAAVELALNFEDPRALRLFRRARKDASEKVKKAAKKGALAFLENLFKSKDFRARMDALIEASEMTDVEGMTALLERGLSDKHEKAKELAVRVCATLKRPKALEAVKGELPALLKDAAKVEFACSYIRALGDYGQAMCIGLIDELKVIRVGNLLKFDGATPNLVKIHEAAFDALGRLRFRGSAQKVLGLWGQLDEATRSRDTAPQTEDGQKVAQKYVAACAAAMFDISRRLRDPKPPEDIYSYSQWKRWFDARKKELPEK